MVCLEEQSDIYVYLKLKVSNDPKDFKNRELDLSKIDSKSLRIKIATIRRINGYRCISEAARIYLSQSIQEQRVRSEQQGHQMSEEQKLLRLE